jgi:hypothetical protein
VGPLPRHDERGDAVGRGLDGQREDREAGDDPPARERAHDRDQADQDRAAAARRRRRADAEASVRKDVRSSTIDLTTLSSRGRRRRCSTTSVTSSPSAIETRASSAKPHQDAAKKTAADDGRAAASRSDPRGRLRRGASSGTAQGSSCAPRPFDRERVARSIELLLLGRG